MVPCADCNLVTATGKIAEGNSSWCNIKNSSCQGFCVDTDDALGLFTDAFLSLLTCEELTCENVERAQSQLCVFLSSTLNELDNGKYRFYLRALVSMEQSASSDEKDKIVTFLNSIAGMFVGKDFENHCETSLEKNARKSMSRYLAESSNFLAMQAVLETLNIFNHAGVNISQLLPHHYEIVVQDIKSLPLLTNHHEFHLAISNITRKLIVDVLKEKNIKVIPLKEEHFMNDKIPSGFDLFLYYQQANQTFNHLVVFSNNKVYMETIFPTTIKLEESGLSLQTEYWKFILLGKYT